MKRLTVLSNNDIFTVDARYVKLGKSSVCSEKAIQRLVQFENLCEALPVFLDRLGTIPGASWKKAHQHTVIKYPQQQWACWRNKRQG